MTPGSSHRTPPKRCRRRPLNPCPDRTTPTACRRELADDAPRTTFAPAVCGGHASQWVRLRGTNYSPGVTDRCCWRKTLC